MRLNTVQINAKGQLPVAMALAVQADSPHMLHIKADLCLFPILYSPTMIRILPSQAIADNIYKFSFHEVLDKGVDGHDNQAR